MIVHKDEQEPIERLGAIARRPTLIPAVNKVTR